MTTSALSIDGLSIRLGTSPVIDDVSLTLGQGESLGIVGESGCGKSTLLKCIAGIYDTWSGTIEVFGRKLAARRTFADRRVLQIVFQDPAAALNPAHTVDAILREPLIVHRLDRQDIRIADVLDAVGLPRSVRFRFPGQISGGQRQRLCIARALLVEPQILLLDEPTSSLDVSVQAEILNLLADLRVERQISYLLISHDLAVVAQLCEQIAVMANGKIVGRTTRAELRGGGKDESYRKLLLPFSRD
ncbi:ABC transporter ATP-binding protein [Rhizobium rhizogenes]|uniref:ABC transporter ATP-binding protein n=1 Tax=Rhizobium rhizogenes TaxID=359 RepID=UPI001572C6B9|nr:ABC transporter ATP-binding protein [Rhizobium rhizogenes]NTF66034.1 ABC transporter ATP-binding protein [Rhizobium rhizogenes]NTG97419.1 ABC transporter ATP-binding protein [Rhizobium rhizogenes]